MSTVAQVDATERKARFLQGPIVDKGMLSVQSVLEQPMHLGNGNGGDDTQGPSACAPGHTSDSGVQCCKPKPQRPGEPPRPDDTNDSGTQCCGGPGHTSDSGPQCCPSPKPPQPPKPKS